MRITLAAAGAAVLCLAIPASAAATSPPAGPSSPIAAPSARVWVTTIDRAEALHERQPVVFRSGTSPLTTITIDPERAYQAMDGFGASITDSSAAVLYRLDPADRDAALRSLFDPRTGIGVSFLRQPVGSSDFTAAAEHYTYDDMPPGQTDYAVQHFSIAHDEAQILPLLRRAKQLNPHLTVLASPWSPPAWMKTTGSLVGGQLIDSPAVYQAYAHYLAKFVRAYAEAGVPIDYLTVQNEPQNRRPNAYPGTDMPVAQQAKVITALGPLLARTSPRTKILAYDHNWATHPGDIESTPPGRSPETDYPYQILADPAARWVAGTAFHCYFGEPSAQSALHSAYPGKGIWFTECSGSHGPSDPPEQYFRDTLKWHARTLAVGVTRNWARTVVNWNLALDASGGPHLGGCGTCTGLLQINDDGTVTTNAEYYTMGHLSKFVQPGAVRIASTNFGTTGWNGQLTDVAFRNPDGSTVLVVHNENDDPRGFAVALGGEIFEYALPGGSIATFAWAPSRAFDDHLTALELGDATATASPNAAEANLAIDDDASTRWSSSQAQTPGQHLQIDLGKQRRFDRIAIDSGGNLGDYARSWLVQVSRDGVTWADLAAGAGTGQLTNVDAPHTVARYIRITSTGSIGNWWSIADLRLYR